MSQDLHPAMYWETAGDSKVRCLLCPHNCVIGVGKRGLCRSRINIEGSLYTQNYGKAISMCADPIEKKPLYHYYPGSSILSMGPNSCNLSCFFCQNYTVSQQDAFSIDVDAASIQDYFDMHPKLPRRLAVTYTEPFTWYEFIYDLARQMDKLQLVLITNGYINAEPLQEILPYIDAMNVDLKSIRDEFYQKHCGGSLAPVLNTIRTAVKQGIHVEVTNLLIPGLNDSKEELAELSQTLAQINWEMPLHISAYYPCYKSAIPATTPQAVLDARFLAKRQLRWVYAGNIGYGRFNDTVCDKCLQTIVWRQPGRVEFKLHEFEKNACPNCLERIWGRF